MTLAQRNAIASPANSLIIYQTDGAPGFYFRSGAVWTLLNFNHVLQQNLNTNGKYLSGDGLNNGLLLQPNGVVLGKGTYASGADMIEAGAGTKLIWYPKKAAFRAGGISSTQWDNVNIGAYSVAFGYSNIAKGSNSASFGYQNTSSNTNAFTAGYQNTASGITSAAIGYRSKAVGLHAISIGDSAIAQGISSMALGYKTLASGKYATAMGGVSFDGFQDAYIANIASGEGSTAMGGGNTASGPFSTVLGQLNKAGGENSVAMGYYSAAYGSNSLAMGIFANADGDYSLAYGYASNASGFSSIAMGNGATTTGDDAFALGAQAEASGASSYALGSYVSTNSRTGSFVLGDNSSVTTTANDADNQMMMRFSGGYKLFTNSSASVGVRVIPGGNSWTTLSDKNRKENIVPVNGEEFLQKIAAFKLASWNYKGQDPKTFRHYGPMAQDFYAAFGKDQYGTIGNDTTINQADFDGINLIAIQALEKRTADLNAKNQALERENKQLIEKVKVQEQQLAQLQTAMNEQQQLIAKRLAHLEALVATKLVTSKETIVSK
jgi:hypothetical protein